MAKELTYFLIDDDGNLILPLSGGDLERTAAASITIKFFADAVEAKVLGASGEVLERRLLPNPRLVDAENGHLAHAAQSSCEFWENPVDDEIWNNA